MTCTDGSTGSRLVLLVMTEYEKPDVPGDIDPEKPHPQTGYDDHLVLWLNILLLSGLSFIGSILCLKRRLLSDER